MRANASIKELNDYCNEYNKMIRLGRCGNKTILKGFLKHRSE